MGTPLKNPPVYLTLAQVRFNQLLKLADFVPGIQENFRQAGYPDFVQQPVISIQLTTQGGQPPTPTTVQQQRFRFGNVEKTHIFILDGQSLTLQSTNYGTFEAFSACFLKGLCIVDEAVKLAFTERVGLRYLDRVMPRSGETIKQYLAEQVHGLNSALGGQPLHAFTEGVNEIGTIKLVSRVAIQDGALAFPPDLQPEGMQIPEKFTSYVGKNAILDNDGFVEGREAFSTKAIADSLVAIHDVIGAAFKATATSYAFKVWDN